MKEKMLRKKLVTTKVGYYKVIVDEMGDMVTDESTRVFIGKINAKKAKKLLFEDNNKECDIIIRYVEESTITYECALNDFLKIATEVK